MGYEKYKSFNLPSVAVDEDAIRSIAAILSKSGPCKYWIYEEAFDSLDALLAGRKPPLDRIELDAPAATVSIYRSGVAIQHLPDAHEIVRELQAALLKLEIPPLVRAANVYRVFLFAALTMAIVRNAFDLMLIMIVVAALLGHTANAFVVKDPVVKLPIGVRSDDRIWIACGVAVVALAVVVRILMASWD